jgi:hypothetical protein
VNGAPHRANEKTEANEDQGSHDQREEGVGEVVDDLPDLRVKPMMPEPSPSHARKLKDRCRSHWALTIMFIQDVAAPWHAHSMRLSRKLHVFG